MKQLLYYFALRFDEGHSNIVISCGKGPTGRRVSYSTKAKESNEYHECNGFPRYLRDSLPRRCRVVTEPLKSTSNFEVILACCLDPL
jgi:hypothetical protein